MSWFGPRFQGQHALRGLRPGRQFLAKETRLAEVGFLVLHDRLILRDIDDRMVAKEAKMEENRMVIEFENSDTPEEVAAARKQREQSDQNSAWLQAHIPEIDEKYRGKVICIAGQELFVGETTRRSHRAGNRCSPGGQRLVHAVHPQRKGSTDFCSTVVSGCFATTVLSGR